jgi:hypothetical protein
MTTSRLSLAAFALIVGCLFPPSKAMEAQPIRAQDLLDSIAVNTHLPYTDGRYVDSHQVLDDLRYIGVSTVRDWGLQKGGQGQDAYVLLADGGVKFDMMIFGWPIPSSVQQLHDFAVAHPGAIIAIEGPNEVNNTPVTYNGQKGADGAKAYQAALFAAVNADPALARIPVYNLTSYPDIGAPADFANAHAYAKKGEQPYDWLERSLTTQRGVMAGKPIVLTETGYYTAPGPFGWGGVDEVTQAKLTLNAIFDSWALGAEKIFIYQLLDAYPDPGGQDQEKHFGLFDVANRPKAAAHALHNLTGVLRDPAPDARSFAPSPAAFTLAGAPSTARTLLLAWASGRHAVVIWNEPRVWDDRAHRATSVAATPVELQFPRARRAVAVYRPVSGPDPVQRASNVRSVRLALADEPIIVTFE